MITEFISMRKIDTRIFALAQQINKAYSDEEVVCICVLKGAYMFFSDLMKSIVVPSTIDFIRVESYKGTESTSDIKLISEPTIELKGKNVLLVEDIIDTGKTLKFLLDYFNEKEVQDINVCTLLDKPSRREVDVSPNYTGFVIPNTFVIGYGLDFNEEYRHLPYIGSYNDI